MGLGGIPDKGDPTVLEVFLIGCGLPVLCFFIGEGVPNEGCWPILALLGLIIELPGLPKVRLGLGGCW